MGLSTFWARVNPFTCSRQTKALRDIHSAEQFRAILDRERARADRNGHQFSLVLFSTGNPQQNGAQSKHATQVLAKRIRLTDEVGWFDDEHVGVVLPYTSAAGAGRLADDICEAIATRAFSLKCKIFTYPSHWFSNGKGNSAQLHFSDLFPEWNTTKSPWHFAYAWHDDGEKIKSKADEQLDNTTSNCLTLTKKLESIFGRSLPAWKRGIDIVGALLGLIVLSPFLLLIVLIIKIVSPGPVLFNQLRVGYMGRTFKMWKFRTMRVDIDSSLHQWHLAELINAEKPMAKLDNDPQIIPFGKILRKTCVDELPQLVNVLRGDMSLVGPRPDVPYAIQYYTNWRTKRFDAVPGMTGLWQVSGKNRTTFEEMIRLDIAYARQMSFWLDVKILLKTVPAIMTQIKYSFSERK